MIANVMSETDALSTPLQRVISADSHVIEPHDLWSSRLTGEFRDAAPKLVSDEKTDRIVCAGMNLEFPVGLAAGVMRNDKDVRAEGRWDEDVPRSAYDPDARIAAMEQDGLVGEVLYPTLGCSMFGIHDHDLLWAFLGAFNSWFGDFCGAHPNRLKGIGMLVLDDGHGDVAVEGLKKCQEQGLAGVMLPLDADDAERLLKFEFDGFWATAEDLEVPIHFHSSSSRSGKLISSNNVVDFVLEPNVMQRQLCGLIFGGLFDRYPRLQVVSAENDASWIGNICERADYVHRRYRNLRADQLKNKRTPSEIIVNSLSLTFTRDFTAPAVSEASGVRLMWGSDFPHNVSTWPNSREYLESQLKGRSPEVVEGLSYSNAVNLYKFPR
jgi:predicted TIM-barrel fold metal-dependent hydrolase